MQSTIYYHIRRLIVSSLALFLPLAAVDDINHDFQLWTYLNESAKLNEDWTMLVGFNNRRDKNATRSYYNYLQLGFERKLCKGWSIAPQYRHEWKKVETDCGFYWEEIAAPLVDVLTKFERCKWVFSHRSRFEYKYPTYEWLYRDMVKIQMPKITYFEFTPIISNEIFLSYFRRLNQNRFQVGLQLYTYGKFTFSAFYMLRSKETSDGWINQNVLNLTIDLKL